MVEITGSRPRQCPDHSGAAEEVMRNAGTQNPENRCGRSTVGAGLLLPSSLGIYTFLHGLEWGVQI
jgi:hypothetical protein